MGVDRAGPTVAIIPARNEAEAIGIVVRETLAMRSTAACPLIDRIIVVNNRSTDETSAVAATAGAEVVNEDRLGYGAACWAGMQHLGDASTIVFIDGDASVPLEQTEKLLDAIGSGADMAIGVRVSGRRDGMSPAQRVGNGLATAMIKLMWGVPVRDLGPFRAVRAEALLSMKMQDRAYGWTVEMQIKAIELGLRVQEIEVGVRPRIGRSKISGTLRGVIGAGIGIITTILKLRLRSKECDR